MSGKCKKVDVTFLHIDIDRTGTLCSVHGKEQMTAGSAHIGIRNVNLRLKILCGPDSGLTLEEIRPGYIRSRIRLPFRRKESSPVFSGADQ